MEDIRARLSAKPRFLIQLAVCDSGVVGYKMGFEDTPTRFHSWQGGVSPSHRKQGIASRLMQDQHRWCRAVGYQYITTHTKNRWRDMLVLNIRHGFDVIGTYTDDRGEPRIMLAKRLAEGSESAVP